MLVTPRTGRPPLPEGKRRDGQIIVRVSPDEKATIEQAAASEHKPTAEWVREAAMDRADPKPKKRRPPR